MKRLHYYLIVVAFFLFTENNFCQTYTGQILGNGTASYAELFSTSQLSLGADVTPLGMLHIEDYSGYQIYLHRTQAGYSSYPAGFAITNAGSGPGLAIQTYNNGTSTWNTNLFLLNDGKVGIGTSVPNALLDVRGTAIFNESSEDYDFRIEGDGNANLFFIDASTDKIGIGTSSPNALLDVRGDAIFNEDGSDYDFRIEGDTKTHLLFVDAGNDRVSIGTSSTPYSFNVDGTSYLKGNVGVAGYPDATYELYVWGDAYATDEFIDGSSDFRLKKNIYTVENALNKIKEMRGVVYEFKTEEFKDKNLPEGKRFGFIAQELKEVVPEIVKLDSDGFYYIKHNGLFSILVEAVKEQQEIIESQNSKIENIENELKYLKEKMSLLNTSVDEKNVTGDKADLTIKY